MSYFETDVILLCFAIDKIDSLETIPKKWLPEINNFCSNVPIILVGNKMDLRRKDCPMVETETRLISTTEGLKLACQIGAFAYVECSAQTRAGVEDVFQLATQAVQFKRRRTRCCLI